MYIARFYKDKVQSVKQHIENVSSLSGKYGKEIGLENFLILTGYLHDIGKYSDDFQNYIKQEQKNEQIGVVSYSKKIDHGVYGAKYIYELFTNDNDFMKYARDIMMEVICYHHGGLPDNISDDCRVPVIERIKKVSVQNYNIVLNRFFEENPQMTKEKISDLFLESTEELKMVLLKFPKSKRGLYLSLLIENIYSILVDADRWDSYLFTIEYNYDDEYKHIHLWNMYEERLSRVLEQFKRITVKSELEKKVKKSREIVSKLCKDFSANDTGIYNLTVPTGGGKTLSSLNFALNHAIKQGKKRIIYVIPYTSIIEQNAEEIRKVLDAKENILEYHSNIIDCNKNENYEIYSERWTSPIIFTTMVQFLNSVYAKGNDNIRRMHNLSNAVIIFDEIQTLPIKCIELFYSLIGYLKDVCNTTSILCTATQPNLMYISDMLDGIKFDGEIISNNDRNELFNNLQRMKVVDNTSKQMDFEEASEFISEIKSKTKSVLVVTNTVKSAQILYSKVSKKLNCETFLLTSRMCPYHRKETIASVKQKLKDKKDIICISTQLIEAGVDISFESVVRSLAGLDSIAQATGRGNRHGKNSVGYSYIIKLKDEKISSLREISVGQSHSQNVMYLCKKSPQKYNGILSENAMNQYFSEYFNDGEIKQNMAYPIDKSQSIISLLNNKKISIANFNSEYPLKFWSQFKTAKQNFNVIDENTETVVVPYNDEANKLIGELLSEGCVNKSEILKKLQPYCVSLYSETMKRLKELNAFIKENNYGVNILSDLFYSKDYGINLKK